MDGIMSLNKDQITALYVSVYGRAPDTEGMNYWLKASSYAEAAAGFVSHAVFTQEYQGDTNRKMVTKFYTNIFGSDGDQEGINFWTNQLDNNVSVNQVLASFLEAALNANLSTDPEGLVRQNVLKNKISVAKHYLENLGDSFSLGDIDPNSADIVHAPDFKQSAEIISNITDNEDTVLNAFESINVIAEGGASIWPWPDDSWPDDLWPNPEPELDLKTTIMTLMPQEQDWLSGQNSVSFTLEFNSNIKLDKIYMIGGGSISMNQSSSTINGLTTVTANMVLANGKSAGSIGIDLKTSVEQEDNINFLVKSFTINGVKYPDTSNSEGSKTINFNFDSSEIILLSNLLDIDLFNSATDPSTPSVSNNIMENEESIGLVGINNPIALDDGMVF